MGFLSTANTVTVTTKLTNAGRNKILSQTNNIFSSFILGDSDANYHTSEILPTGKIPTSSGTKGQNSAENVIITSRVYTGAGMQIKRLIEPSSNKISVEVKELGNEIVSGHSLNYVMLDKDDNSIDFTNLFKSLSLPITNSQIDVFDTPSQNGGWLDTAFSGFAATDVLIAAIDNDEYGELIDGKNIKCILPIATGYTSGGTVSGITTIEVYSTFPKTTITKINLDTQYKDNSSTPTDLFRKNINVAYLVSDSVQRPNDDNSKSWSTGYDTFKPFSINSKELINVNTVSSTGIVADKVIGIAYLDKGILAFTDPVIVDNVVTNFSGDPATSAFTNSLGLYHYTANTFNTTVNSIETNIIQNLLCIAPRNMFYRSENKTRSQSDDIRLSEIAIVDSAGDILAIGKFDRQVIKKKNDFTVFNVEIVV